MRSRLTLSLHKYPRLLLHSKALSQLALASALRFLALVFSGEPAHVPALCMALWPGTPLVPLSLVQGLVWCPLVTGGGDVSEISWVEMETSAGLPCHNFEVGLGKQKLARSPLESCATLAGTVSPLLWPSPRARQGVLRGLVRVRPALFCLSGRGCSWPPTSKCLPRGNALLPFGALRRQRRRGTPQARRDYLSRLSFLGESLTECGGLSEYILSLLCLACREGRHMSSARRVRSQGLIHPPSPPLPPSPPPPLLTQTEK